MRVLIVEDSRLFQASLIALLVDLPGIDVVGQAFSGKEALECIERQRPDVVILDLGLPQGDGFSVLESTTKGDSPLMVIISFSASEAVRRRCGELGAHFFHSKASAPDALLDFLGHLVEGGPDALSEARQYRGADPEEFTTLQNT